MSEGMHEMKKKKLSWELLEEKSTPNMNIEYILDH